MAETAPRRPLKKLVKRLQEGRANRLDRRADRLKTRAARVRKRAAS
jgi:hypothetical protein